MTDDTEGPEPIEDEASRRLLPRLRSREPARDVLLPDARPAPAGGGPHDAPAHVPYGVDLAAGWAWRFLVIVAAGYLIARVVGFFMVIVLPLVIALLIAALVTPLVRGLRRAGLPNGPAALVVVTAVIGSVGALLTFAGQQVAKGATDLANQVVAGLQEITDWLKTGPLHATDSQINTYIEQAQTSLRDWTANGDVLGRITEVGTAVGHVLAGFFIVLFASYFFLADGAKIWSWIVRLSPRAARGKVDSSGRVAWISLTKFVRATVIVALVDSIGIMIWAAIFRVPFVLAIGVLVFVGAFIPMVGAFVAGTVAVLVALVDQGPIIALVMLGGVVLVQQLEGHVLQPFLMGRFVSIHPLGIIVAIGCGVLVAGIPGALVAVPLAAAVNAVVLHLAEGDLQLADGDAGGDDPPDDPPEDPPAEPVAGEQEVAGD